MHLSLVTAPTLEPLTVAEAMSQCRVEDGDDPNTVAFFTWGIRAARRRGEMETRRGWLSQQWQAVGDGYPCGEWRLPMPPTLSVDSITYYDETGTQRTLAASAYQVVLPAGPHASRARVAPAVGTSWPAVQCGRIGGVVLTFTCGYGTEASDVPDDLVAGLRMLVGHFWENRESVVVADRSSVDAVEIPQGVRWLWEPYRDLEWR